MCLNSYSEWGISSTFGQKLKQNLQKTSIKNLFNENWELQEDSESAINYKAALNQAIKDKDKSELFSENAKNQSAIAFFKEWFKVDSTKNIITWKPEIFDEQTVIKNLISLGNAIKVFLKSQQGLTQDILIEPCCRSEERMLIFKKWVKVDPEKVAVEINIKDNDTDETLNQTLIDIAAAIAKIEDTTYYDKTLPEAKNRGIFADKKYIAINLANLELRIAALEGRAQTFCCSDDECKQNCLGQLTLSRNTCTINPECRPHPTSIVSLSNSSYDRTINIIKRALALFPIYSEADGDEGLTTSQPNNICLICPRPEALPSSEIQDASEEPDIQALSEQENTEASKNFTRPPSNWDPSSHKGSTGIDHAISTFYDTDDPLNLGRYAIHYACEECNKGKNWDQADWLQHIIDNDNNIDEHINRPRHDGNTPLHIVAQLAQKQECDPAVIKRMIKILLDTGALLKINLHVANTVDKTTTPNAGTPTDIAIFTSYYSGNTAAEEALTNKINQYKLLTNTKFMPKKPENFSPKSFFEATILGNDKTVTTQITALNDALKNGTLTSEEKKQLINMPDYVDLWQRTALHYAAAGCKKSYNSIVQLLLENGANPNAQSIEYDYLDQAIPVKSGKDTPLHVACSAALLLNDEEPCDQNVIFMNTQALLKNGANPNIRNAEQNSAYDLSALTNTETGNSEASIALMNYVLQPCTQLAQDLKNKKNINLDALGKCLNVIPFIEGTHELFDKQGNQTYFCALDPALDPKKSADKLYFIETMITQLEGTYGSLFVPIAQNCALPDPVKKNQAPNDGNFDFVKILSDFIIADNLPTLFTQNSAPDSITKCRIINASLRLLRAIAAIIQPDTSLEENP